LEYICVFEYINTQHLFPQIYSNLPFYKMKWNSFIFNIFLRLYFNILCKNIVKLFQKFEMGYIQTCTPLENNTMWHPKGSHHSVLLPYQFPFGLALPWQSENFSASANKFFIKVHIYFAQQSWKSHIRRGIQSRLGGHGHEALDIIESACNQEIFHIARVIMNSQV
jgi:hypothetical protein